MWSLDVLHRQVLCFAAAVLVVTTWPVGVSSIPLGEFYPFGSSAGDLSIGPTLDGSSPEITLTRVFPFYGRNYFIIYVNNNGHVSFDNPISTFDPLGFPLNDGTPLIAPYWADADTRISDDISDAGTVWYRESTDQADRDRAQREIRRAFPGQAARFTPRLVFIATWDHVGYHHRHIDKTNTFQCILTSDGFMSYVIFLYADGLIQWTSGDDSDGVGGLGGNPAHIGVNAGDGRTFITHEYSFTANVLNIANSRVPSEESRVERSGMLVYRVDSAGVTECVDIGEQADLILTPGFGNQLGGTPVLIQGLCFLPSDDILCIFDGNTVVGRYVNQNIVMCTTPVMETAGTVDVSVHRLAPGTRQAIIATTFTAVPPLRAHQVGFSVESSDEEMQLYFKPQDVVTLTWLPREVVPNYLFTDPESIRINIQLFQMVDKPSVRWVPVAGTLMSNLDNDGMAQFTVPQNVRIERCLNQGLICPVAFNISAMSSTVVRVFGDDEVPLPSGPDTPETGIWSSIAYLQQAGVSMGDLIKACLSWTKPPAPDSRRNMILESMLSSTPACPPILSQAMVDTRYRQEAMDSGFTGHVTGYAKAALKFYSPQATACYVQVVMEARPGQQCCYRANGELIQGQAEPAGGSVDRSSPLTGYNRHILDDLLPFVFCCRGGRRCNDYDELRPSSNARFPPYRLPVPACVYGDPHIVTLDGHKYTFNGKGEFTLVETHDASFTLQGRMEQAVGGNGTATGTVFTSIVAQQVEGGVGRRVEFQVNQQGDLDVLVNGMMVNFEALSEQTFQQVVVTDRGNSTAVAEFSGGSSIEITVQNDIISVMLVTLPNRYRSLTRGLMGNYNDDAKDDLIPKNASISIPPDSSVEEIFAYGNTWIINDASNSLFAYNHPGNSFEGFRDTDFRPAFAPVFDDIELEMKADEICGDDQFCRFDIAATKNEDIGASTMVGGSNFDEIVQLAEPIVCVPPCENGVCVATNSCSCSVGFSGQRCTQKIVSECDMNMCQNNATCVQHAQSFTCKCPDGYIGTFCQEKEPPFSLRLINSSPRTSNGGIAVEFLSSKPVLSAKCTLFNSTTVDCTSGLVRFSDASPGPHRIIIMATALTGETAVERRTVYVCNEDMSSCGVNLINEGVTVTRDCANIQFTSCGLVDSFQCRLNEGRFTRCYSPMRRCGLEVKTHRLQVTPEGAECREKGRLSINFDII